MERCVELVAGEEGGRRGGGGKHGYCLVTLSSHLAQTLPAALLVFVRALCPFRTLSTLRDCNQVASWTLKSQLLISLALCARRQCSYKPKARSRHL
eukprot:12196173-Karenia_brevis.AAC.1